MKRTRGTCAYCGAPAVSFDHCTPLSRGGANDPDNMVGCCTSCNSKKRDKTVLEFMGLWPRRDAEPKSLPAEPKPQKP